MARRRVDPNKPDAMDMAVALRQSKAILAERTKPASKRREFAHLGAQLRASGAIDEAENVTRQLMPWAQHAALGYASAPRHQGFRSTQSRLGPA